MIIIGKEIGDKPKLKKILIVAFIFLIIIIGGLSLYRQYRRNHLTPVYTNPQFLQNKTVPTVTTNSSSDSSTLTNPKKSAAQINQELDNINSSLNSDDLSGL